MIVVDDEPFMLEGMRLMIDWNRCGFALCGEAGTVQEALRLLDTVKPHLLLTDVRMPGMLGTDLAAIVSHYHPEIIILFFSGFRDFSYAQCAIRTHAFGYLTKPIDADEVHETLLRVKAELDRRNDEQAEARRSVVLRDQVLRRVALGDDSVESLMRTAALLQIKRADPCYCAVVTHEHSDLPEGVRLLLTTCGAVPFQLSPRQYGLGFKQLERNLPLLAQLAGSMAGAGHASLSAGDVHRGAEGFGKSLREALDAQGVLFETRDAVRLYRPFDAETAAWLARVQPTALHDAVCGEQPEPLAQALTSLRRHAEEARPSLFALRYLAAMLDSLLAADTRFRAASPLRALWQSDALAAPAWLDAFAQRLTALHAQACADAGVSVPAPAQAALAVIRTRYAEPLSLAGVADELHMNAAYLGQLVRRYSGETFHHRLLATRVSHACVLLRQTTLPVGEVALGVGFRDVDYFSQQFRGRMGMSPVAYRNAETAGKGDSLAPHQ